MARDGLVQPTRKYRSIRHMEYKKKETEFLIEWEAPFVSLSYKTDRFHVAVRLIRRRGNTV